MAQLTADILGGIGAGQKLKANRLVLQQQQLQNQQAAEQQRILASIGGQPAPAQQPQQGLLSRIQSSLGFGDQTGQTAGFVPPSAQTSQPVQPAPATQKQQLARLFVLNPDLAAKIQKQLGAKTQQQIEDNTRRAFELERTPPDERDALIDRQAQQLLAEGRNPTDTLALKGMTEDEQNQALHTIQLAGLSNEDRLKILKGENGNGGALRVQSSSILPDGTVQLVFSDGSIKVVSPSEADKILIKSAQEFGAGVSGLRAGERGAAKESIKIGVQAFKDIVTARKAIAVFDEGINLLKSGAKTGVVENRLPSIRAASIKLDNLRSRLGLGIIQATTFGSLSEAELKFALATALPQNLDEKDLIKWLQDKRDAQRKLITNLEEVASFLSIPGNNLDDFLRIKKAQKADRQSAQQSTGQPSATANQSAAPQGVTLNQGTSQPTRIGRFTVEVQ